VEVLLREQDANLIEGLVRENRIDQRMPLEPDHRLLSPFQEKRMGTRLRFPAENQPATVGTRRRSGQIDSVHFTWKGCCKSRFCLGTPRRAFLFIRIKQLPHQQVSGCVQKIHH
jgi:hypothetical protein